MAADVVWIPREVAVAIHRRVLAEHGGSGGVRDSGRLDAALARPRQQAAYNDPDRYALAATYADGMVRNHPFVDGNKRVAFLLAYVFLRRNGIRLVAAEDSATRHVMALAAGDIDATAFAAWLRANSTGAD